MKTDNFKLKLLASVVAAGLGVTVPSLYAAESENADNEEQTENKIYVTGSRIARNEVISSSPVTAIDSAEINFTGTVRIEDMVSSLPQSFAGQNSTVANGASGTATVNLRHLGTSRTLVLINGRRMAPGDVFSTAPDLNFIPSPLVKRVDVLTGGASSVYGTDAVAGVVNFILDTDFEGIQTNFKTSFYQHDNSNSVAQGANEARGFDFPTGNVTDGYTYNASIAMGGSFAEGKGHASGYITYRDIEAILKEARDYTNCTIQTGSSGPRCGGSSTTPRGRFIVFDPVSGVKAEDLVLDWEAGGTTFRDRNGEVFNYGPFNHIQRPDTKWTMGGFVEYEFTDNDQAYLEVMFMDDYTDAQIAPSGNFGRTSTLNCDNPMLSSQQFNLLCGQFGLGPGDTASVTILRRNIEGGPRTNQIRHTSFRMMSGIKGELNENWTYDVYGLYGVNLGNESYINDLNTDRIKDALDVVVDPSTGEWVCRSGNAGCVPWNIFSQGGVTPEAVAYISTVAVMNSNTSTQVFDASVAGDLDFAFSTASDPVQVAFGVQYRKESLEAVPDEVYSKGLRAGSGGKTPPIDGGFDVTEFYGEAVVPLIQGAELAEELTLELGYRTSDYSTAGKNNTFKTQLLWSPTEDIRVRAGFNRAVRAPNALELFRPQGFGLGGNQDICANDPSTGQPSATFEQCARTGVTQAQYGTIIANPADQYNTLGGGNPELGVETADTTTFGLVLTPQFMPEFNATIDYYDIQIEDAIGSLGADDIIQTCANTGDATLCSLIHRDSAGTLWLTNEGYTETTNQNIGQLGSKGVDINAQYTLDIGENGSLKFGLIGTYLMASTFSNPLTDYDCVGYFGNQCGQPDAKWRHRARVSWASNYDLTLSLGWRFISGTDIDDASPDSDLGDPGAMDKWKTNGIDKLDSTSYFDLVATYDLNDDMQLTFGINNLADKEPPLAPSISSTGFSGTYDPLGRYIFVGFQGHY